jgi:hypothetical protein
LIMSKPFHRGEGRGKKKISWIHTLYLFSALSAYSAVISLVFRSTV